MINKFTPGPWRMGRNNHCVVADCPVRGVSGSDEVEYYDGHLVAESITRSNAALISAAPELLDIAFFCRDHLQAMRRANNLSAAITALLDCELERISKAIKKAGAE